MRIGEKVFCFVALFLVLAFSCFAQGVRKDDIAISSVGGFLTGVPNAQVRVCVNGALGLPCSPTVPIYSNSDLALGHALPNPFTADNQGNYFFYVLPGTYEVQVTTPTGTYTQNDQTYPNLPSVVTTTFNYTLVASSSTPVFSFVPNMMYRMVLTSNVASSTLVGVPAPGNVAAFSLCQDGVGGRTFSFPSNFVLPSGFIVNPFAGVCTNFIFLYDGTNWQGTGGWSQVFSLTLPVSVSQGGTGVTSPAAHGVAIGEGSSTPFNFAVPTNNAQCFMSSPTNFSNIDPSFQTCPGGGGGGGSSAGPQGTFNAAGLVAGTFQVTNLSESGGVLTNGDQNSNRGPNPSVDVTFFGARAVNPSAIPATNCTITGGTNSASCISTAGLRVGDGYAITTAGPSQSMATPAAPTVTPSCAAGPTGLGFTVPAGAGGTPYAYSVALRDQGQGLTVASPNGTTATGNAALGARSTNIVSTTAGILNTFTTTVGSSADMAPGCMVVFKGSTDDAEFGGWKIITSVPDGTHVTWVSGINAAIGITTNTATGGNMLYWLGNHLVLPTPGGAGTQYAVYGRTSGSMSFLQMSLLANLGYTDPTYNTFDDYGSPMMDGGPQPWFVPSTPPVSPTNDTFTSTIATIVGNTLTFAGNAPNSSTGSAASRFDNAPAINASLIATNSTSITGAGGTIRFPAVAENSVTGNYCYVTSTYIVAQVNAIIQDGEVCLGDTLQLTGNWYGTDNSAARLNWPPNATRLHIPILIQGANPGIWIKSAGGLNKVSVNMTTNGGVGVFNAQMNAAQVFEDDNFFSNLTTDYMSIAFYDYQSSVSGGFGGKMRNTAWAGGPDNVTVGRTATPIFATKFSIEWDFDYVNCYARGYAFVPFNAGLFGNFHMGEECQGNIMPIVMVTPATVGNTSGSFKISQAVNDTGPAPLVANLGPLNAFTNADITIEGGNLPSAGQPLISGSPFLGSVFLSGLSPGAQIGQNINLTVIGKNGNFASQLRTPSIRQAAINYTANHTLLCNEGIVNAQATLTFTIDTTCGDGQGYDVYSETGTTTLTVSAGTLHVDQTTGPRTILNNSGVHVFLKGGNAYAAGLTKPYAGVGAGIVTGPTISANNDLVVYTGLGGQTADSGISFLNVALRNAGNVFSTGVQDFSAVSEFRPKAGTIASIPVACNIPDIYFGTDATPGQNWFFCTVSGNPGTWTQQLNSGFLGLNTYSGPHTLNINETWANFNATTTVTVPHAINTRRWVVFCVSPCSTLTLAPDSGNITLNNLTALTAAITTGLGVEVACDGTNCFAWGLGGSGGGSGTVSSCTVNGVAYYSAVTTTFCVTPPTSPNGVPSTLTSTPSGGVSQPPALSLPGIVGRAVSGIAATDTIGNGTGTGAAPGGSTDCSPNRVEYVGSVAVAVALPTATVLGVPKCVFKLVNATVPPQDVTITPTTWTINGSANLTLKFGQQLWVYVDPNSTTNWVADQTDLFGNVSGAAVPVSAKLLGTNSGAQLIAAALASTHVYVGSAGNLPVDVAISGDATLSNTGALTVIGANGGTFPASASVLGTNVSKQPVAATAHGIALPWQCADTSGSSSAQVCNTSPTFTPVAGDTIIYTTTTGNVGTSLTINVNSLGAKPVAIWQTTTTVATNTIRANTEVLLTYDGTNWELATVGNSPSGSGQNPCTLTNLSIQYDNGGNFGCVAEFTYASSTITASTTGKIDLTSASVTAGFHLPSAAGAAPTNGGIASYDQTNNDLVWGNATNTSRATWTTSNQTGGNLAQFNTAQGQLVSTTAIPNGTTATTQATLSNDTKVATDAYADTAVANAIAAVNPAVAVLAATAGSNLTGTYSNGASGIGATFTVTATGVFTLDGVAINTIGQRVLLKDQTSGFQNGVYTATVVGAVAVSPVFTRALDYNQPSNINSTGAIPVQSGTVNASTSWLLTSTVNTVGTDALTYVQFSIASSNIVTQISNAASGQVCTYTGANKVCVPATALPNGVTATTQTVGDNTTKVATDAFVLANAGSGGVITGSGLTTGNVYYNVGGTLTPANAYGIPSALTVTFTNGSANIASVGNTLIVGAAVQFQTTGSLPTNFSTSTTYFVITTGSPFTVSATYGGSAVSAGSAGSGTQTLTIVPTLVTNPAYCVASSATVCVFSGPVTGLSGFTAGQAVYVSDATSGALTNTNPASGAGSSGHFVQRIGVATSTTAILVTISPDVATVQ